MEYSPETESVLGKMNCYNECTVFFHSTDIDNFQEARVQKEKMLGLV